jgi:SAM-dependent methyltransferase
MHVEIDGGAEQVRTVSQPGQGRTVDAVTGRLEERRQPLPGPTATEGTADQNEIGDGSLLPPKAAAGFNLARTRPCVNGVVAHIDIAACPAQAQRDGKEGPEMSGSATAMKERQKAAWATGDLDKGFGVATPIVGELLCEAVDVHGGERVLDVGGGTGNTALAAARRGAEVTGVDIVAAALAHARQRFTVEGLTGTFVETEAESLPFPNDSFDVVLSTFGVMFTRNRLRGSCSESAAPPDESGWPTGSRRHLSGAWQAAGEVHASGTRRCSDTVRVGHRTASATAIRAGRLGHRDASSGLHLADRVAGSHG